MINNALLFNNWSASLSCSACKRELKLVGRGLCRACYSRWHKRGTTDYAPKPEPRICEIHGCDAKVLVHGLCDKHRTRLRRHGSIEDTRPESWGAIEKHPLKHSWSWMRRHRGIAGICPEWEKDFLQFVADVGERPSKAHKLFSADESRPIGPGNFVWKRCITEKADGETEASFSARRQRVYRKIKTEESLGYRLKHYFGLSVKEYEAMYESQSGRCYLCGNSESAVIRGKTLMLAVDHCHKSGKVRALLCSQCNTGLGLFKDSPELLKRAAEYVTRHAVESDEPANPANCETSTGPQVGSQEMR